MQNSFQITSLEEYNKAHKESVESPETFWGAIASTFQWRRKWDKVLSYDFIKPEVKWFEGAKLNITENALDRNLEQRGDDIALIWEPNDPFDTVRKYTYSQLYEEVKMFSSSLRKLGIKKGDRVCIYMGMIPQLSIAMLACARIGAIHSVIFGGFSAQSIYDRVLDAEAEYIICADGAFRGNRIVALKDIVDEALNKGAVVKNVIVYQHTQSIIHMEEGRDLWWHHLAKTEDGELGYAEEMEAEDPFFILYTSGSTGKPKGVVHSSAGYMVYITYSFLNVFQYKKGEVFFCSADVGWITGHSYIIYGPLLAGATALMFEGIPTWPDAGRFWDIVQKHKVNILYTAPTAIRSLMAYGESPFEGKDISSLRVIGTVGEPINEEAWHWYHKNAGMGKCEVVDTWFQTETGGILISNLAGVTPSKPSFATLPLPGVDLLIVDEKGEEVKGNPATGNLCIRAPWPSIIRTTYRDHERCRQAYFSSYPNLYFTGDGALRDENGFYRITGRVDDVLNVSGHRLGTAEIENAIGSHPSVIECAVVGFPHDIKGQGIYAFVILSPDAEQNVEPILATVAKEIGPLAKPDKIQFVTGLPKTRSGKIMRRILRKIAEGELSNMGDTSTLLDPQVVQSIADNRIS